MKKKFQEMIEAYPHTRFQGTIQNDDNLVEPIIW
jgi:hypothetical protein